MSFDNQLYGLEELTVTFTDQSTVINSIYGIQTRNESFVLTLRPAEDPSGDDCGLSIWQTAIFALVYVGLVFALVNAFLLQSTLVVFHLIGNIQIIGLAAFYEAVYPTCLVNFLKSISIIGVNLSFFGGQIFSSFISASSFAVPENYKYERMGVETSSLLINGGDVLFLWAILFLVLFLVLAVEFVLNSIPYVVNVCQRYRYNFMACAMNFTWLKLCFDCAVDFNYFNMSNSDQKVSGFITLTVAAFMCIYVGYVCWHAGLYTVELQTVEKDEDLKNIRSKHIMVEYNTAHPSAFYYLLTQAVKKSMFVGIAIYAMNEFKYQLLLSATVAFFSAMLMCYIRPFKSPFFNMIIIFEDVMLFLLYLILFRYISKDSVQSLSTSRNWARIFVIALFIMCVVPLALHLLDMIRTMKHVGTICDCKPRFRDDESSDSEKKSSTDSEDLRPGDDSNSIVEKTITLTDNSLEEVNEGKGRAKTPPLAFNEEPPAPEKEVKKISAPPPAKPMPVTQTPPVQNAAPASEPPPAATPQNTAPPPQGGPPPAAPQTNPAATTQAATNQAQPTPNEAFDSLNFKTAVDQAAAEKGRLPDVSNI